MRPFLLQSTSKIAHEPKWEKIYWGTLNLTLATDTETYKSNAVVGGKDRESILHSLRFYLLRSNGFDEAQELLVTLTICLRECANAPTSYYFL